MRFVFAGAMFSFSALMLWRTWKNDRAWKAVIDDIGAKIEAERAVSVLGADTPRDERKRE